MSGIPACASGQLATTVSERSSLTPQRRSAWATTPFIPSRAIGAGTRPGGTLAVGALADGALAVGAGALGAGAGAAAAGSVTAPSRERRPPPRLGGPHTLRYAAAATAPSSTSPTAPAATAVRLTPAPAAGPLAARQRRVPRSPCRLRIAVRT